MGRAGATVASVTLLFSPVCVQYIQLKNRSLWTFPSLPLHRSVGSGKGDGKNKGESKIMALLRLPG